MLHFLIELNDTIIHDNNNVTQLLSPVPLDSDRYIYYDYALRKRARNVGAGEVGLFSTGGIHMIANNPYATDRGYSDTVSAARRYSATEYVSRLVVL